jgi:hypothetical protein
MALTKGSARVIAPGVAPTVKVSSPPTITCALDYLRSLGEGFEVNPITHVASDGTLTINGAESYYGGSYVDRLLYVECLIQAVGVGKGLEAQRHSEEAHLNAKLSELAEMCETPCHNYARDAAETPQAGIGTAAYRKSPSAR